MERGVGLGALVGIVVILLLGWVPLIGPLIAGYIAGLHAKHRNQGAEIGFAIGAVGALIMTWLFYIAPSQVFVITEGPLSGWVGTAFTYYYSLGPLVLISATVIMAIIGGALGGIASEKRSS